MHATVEFHDFQREAIPLLHQREKLLLHQRETTGGFHESSAMSTTSQRSAAIHFDLDSFPVGIDNRAPGCISFNRGDFADNLWKCDHVIKRKPRNQTSSTPVWTLQWSWEDNRGKRHNVEIPNSYFDPLGTV